MTAERRFYVYVHKRATDGTPFYYGKGTGRRAWELYDYFRSEWHARVKRKHGVIVEIVKDCLTSDEAYDLEEKLIAEARLSGAYIVNIMEDNRITSEIARSGGKRAKELGVGIHGLPKAEVCRRAGEAGKKGGRLPWWNNTNTGEETRSENTPGEGWVRGRSAKFKGNMSLASKSQHLKNPDHLRYYAKIASRKNVEIHTASKTGFLTRVVCSCGKEMNIGNICRHQKATGHVGWNRK